MSMMNRLGNAKNPYQGNRPKTLCVCSAGLLRSPTLAWVLSNPPYNHNTRAAGVSNEYALIPVDRVLLSWAELVVCAEDWHATVVKEQLEKFGIPGVEVIALNIPDSFGTRDPFLVKIINESLETRTIKKYEEA